eukprot:2370601-Rhodomonas_salina.6
MQQSHWTTFGLLPRAGTPSSTTSCLITSEKSRYRPPATFSPTVLSHLAYRSIRSPIELPSVPLCPVRPFRPISLACSNAAASSAS